MARVKIKRLPKSGDQVDGSLYRRSSYNDVEETTDSGLTKTMPQVTKEKANVEAEKGETVLTPYKGYFSFQNIGGKKHYDGGTYLDLDAGSFIFSNAKDRKIKDLDVLKKFGVVSDKYKSKDNQHKKGFTPAEISKRFQTNEDLVNATGEDVDAITKRTAVANLENKINSLAELALIQELDKGLPDGIPSFVQSVLPDVAMALQEQLPMIQQQGNNQMAYAQQGGNLEGDVISIDGKTFRVLKTNVPKEKSLEYLEHKHGLGNFSTLMESTFKPNKIKPYLTLQPVTIKGNEFINNGEIVSIAYEDINFSPDKFKRLYRDSKYTNIGLETNAKLSNNNPFIITARDSTTVNAVNTVKAKEPTIPTAQSKGRQKIGEPIYVKKQGGSIQYMKQAGEVKIQSYNDNTYDLEIDGKVIFSTYKGGLNTPTGENESWRLDAKQMSEYISQMKKAGIDFTKIKSASDFQDKLYDYVLGTDPDAILGMWKKYGQTIHGEKALTTDQIIQLEKEGVKINKAGKAYTFDFSGVTDKAKRTEIAKILKGSYTDGKIGVRTLGIMKPVEQTPKPEESNKPIVDNKESDNTYKGDVGNLLGKYKQMPTTGYLPDYINFMNAIGVDIDKVQPMLSQVDLETPDYTLISPDRNIAASQSNVDRYYQMLESGLDPNVAAATALGMSGENANNLANMIAQTEAQNIGIINQSAANKSQINNQEQLMNQQLRDKFIGESATFSDNLRKEQMLKQLGVTRTFTNLWDNIRKKKAMEQVLFPDIYNMGITGDWFVDPSGRDMLGPDTYENPFGNTSGGENYMQNILQASGQAFNYAKQMGMKEEDAAKYASSFATGMMRNMQGKNNQNRMSEFLNQFINE